MGETRFEQMRERLALVEPSEHRRGARSGGNVGALLFDIQRDLCSVLETERVMSYALEVGDGGVKGLRFCHRSHVETTERTSAVKWFGRYVAATPRWARFNPLRPQRQQRNRLMVWTRDSVLESPAPTVREAYPVLGLDGRAQARALLCSEDSLLAFVGAWQPDAFRPQQLATFRALVPLLLRRLELAALVDVAPAGDAAPRALVDAALEAIPRPVMVLGCDGQLREANQLAQQILKGRGDEVARGARDVARGQPPASWRVTRAEQRGGALEYLVLLPLEEVQTAPPPLAAFTRTWQLTARQSNVLALLCEGRSNESIAAVLAISIRTVEAHVAALFDKSRVSSRSALVAKVLSPS
jgi:DNA-binding CsgD family transcriptional regulator/PAS domain-containing protein